MSTFEQFFEPMLIRFRQRRRCFHCEDKATVRCRIHRTAVCSDNYCSSLHRLGCNGTKWGSLIKYPSCEFVAMNSWVDHLVKLVGALAAGVVFIWFFTVMGVL